MNLENVSKVLIVVEFDNGKAHQVLSTKGHKNLAIRFLSGLDDGLKVSDEIEPFTLKSKTL